MFDLGDKFDIKSRFNWENVDEDGLSNDSSLESSLLKPVCSDPEMPPKGLYFIGSRTVTSSFGEEVLLKGSSALRWLFGKGHTNYENGFLNEPYDKPKRLDWLKNSRAKNIAGLFENKVIAHKKVLGADFSDGYYIIGIADDSNSSDSVHFRFWYIDCARKINTKKLPPNGIDIQSACPGCQGNSIARLYQGDVPIVDGNLPGWASKPDGTIIFGFKYGMDLYRYVNNIVSIFKTADTPPEQRRIVHTLDRSATEFYFEHGKTDWDTVLAGETDSNKKPSKYTYSGYKSMEEEEMDLSRAKFRLKYDVTETWTTKSGKVMTLEGPPTFMEGTCSSTSAKVGYWTETDNAGVHRTTFYQINMYFKLKGLLNEELDFEVYKFKKGASDYFLRTDF